MSDTPLIIAHRGGAGLWPENTLYAFQRAAALGADGVEFDVHLSKDGHVMIHHDAYLNCDIACDGQGHWVPPNTHAIGQMSLSQLQRYTVGVLKPGSPLIQRFPNQESCAGLGIPTLADLLALNLDLTFFLELKGSTQGPDALADAVLKDLNAADALKRTVFLSFDLELLNAVRAHAPTALIAYAPPTDAHAVAAQGFHVWSADHRLLTIERVQEAHALGLQVLAWTPNTLAELEHTQALQVDGIITDHPQTLLSLPPLEL